MRRFLAAVAVAVVFVVTAAGPAAACGGLVGPNGTVQLVRTSTLAAYVDGVEHYVTSFEFSGGGAEVGSIVPLPGIPTSVEKGGAWTLQRLAQEVAPPSDGDEAAAALQATGEGGAEVLLEARIDALELTVLRGGGTAVGDWAREHGFGLTPDAPEILDFYAERSPIFLAARFDAAAARERGQGLGDGTPVHLTIPTDDPWVPLRILGLGLRPGERVEADVFLLTDRRPALLGGIGDELSLERSEQASRFLLDDLRSDEGMAWVPRTAWLSYLQVDAAAGSLDFDLAVDASGAGRPSVDDAGFNVQVGDAGTEAAVSALLPVGTPGPVLALILLCSLGAAAAAWVGVSAMAQRRARP